MLKENLIRYIEEITLMVDLDHIGEECTAETIAQKFIVKRNTVSHYLNQEVGEILFKVNTRPVRFLSKKVFEEKYFPVTKAVYTSMEELLQENDYQERISVEENNSLQQMIGAKGSLKKAVEQVKTSVFYPKSSLPILLQGPTGVGKSYMVKKIYDFSVENEVLLEEAPFITLNCAQYANNVELLSSNLFGYVKGAFTGAYGNTKGMLEVANGGMLFLDEVHRLSSESQEKLFIFLDKGVFRKMGESDGWHKSDVRIVMATTEDLASNFLDTFLRRIPIIINIPSLTERGYQERLHFIYHFFINESKVLNRNISISGNVLDALSIHQYKGNVGELQNIIKCVCATTYARNKQTKEIKIHLQNLPEGVLTEIAECGEVKIKSNQSILIMPESKLKTILQKETVKNPYYLEMMQKLISIYGEFKTQKYEEEQFQKRCFHTINDMLDHLIYDQGSEAENMMMKYIIGSVHEAFRYVEYSCNVRFGGNVLHAVATYFFYLNNNTIEHETEKKIPKDFIEYINKHYQREIQIAKRMIDMLNSKMDILSREEDLIPLALYFKSLDIKSIDNRCKAIILAHGYATASSIANVANRLLDENIFESVDMPINKSIDDVIEYIKDYLQYHDVSNGLLLMVDMGSLKEIYLSLEQCLRVPVAIVNNISTQMAVFAGNKLLSNAGLKDVLETLEEYNQTEYKIIYPKVDKQKILITCCLTGVGTAEQIRGLIEESIPKDVDIKVVSYDYNQLRNSGTIEMLKHGYDILGIIGTVNPKIENIEFIPLEEVVSGEADAKMLRILGKVVSPKKVEEMNNNLIRNFSMKSLIGSLTILDTDKILNHIDECLKKYELISGEKLQNSTKINMYIHVGCLVERLIRRCPIEDYPNLAEFEENHKSNIRLIEKALSDIEKTYSVKIPLSEIGYIFNILSEI